MSDSILSNDRRCFICGYEGNLHRHHVFGGVANRSVSEREGCWCFICAKHHNMSDNSVHFNRDMDLKLKRFTQKKWEEKNGTREDFIRLFGKSWL